jgi:hypothetical protein
MKHYYVFKKTVIEEQVSVHADSADEAKKMVLVDKDWDDAFTIKHDVTIEGVVGEPDPKPELTAEELEERHKNLPPVEIPAYFKRNAKF